MSIKKVVIIKAVQTKYQFSIFTKPFIYEARDSNNNLFVCVYLDGWIYCYFAEFAAHDAQSSLAFKFLASESWVCYRAVAQKVDPFSVEYKTFIIVAEFYQR